MPRIQTQSGVNEIGTEKETKKRVTHKYKRKIKWD